MVAPSFFYSLNLPFSQEEQEAEISSYFLGVIHLRRRCNGKSKIWSEGYVLSYASVI